MNEKKQAWIVAVNMGYGHQRAAYPLRDFSPKREIITANDYKGIPDKDKFIWESSRKIYEFISRFNNIPYIGRHLFDIYDKNFQAIPDFYPRKDLSKPSYQIRKMYKMIRKGWGKHLIEKLNKKNIPMISTFFTQAFMAEEHGFKNEIYCIICDADISRSWIPLNPKKTRIKYLAPCRRAAARLRLYGIPEKNISITGFPLPKENLGEDLKIVKKDLKGRIIRLDPHSHFRIKYSKTIKQFLGHDVKIERTPPKQFTVTFAVGGAGAQKKLAKDILVSLRNDLCKRKLNLNLVAGNRKDVYNYFHDLIINDKLYKCMGKNLNIIYEENKYNYFRKFNIALRRTDILWTKPSELSFYTALGLPILMAPTIGSQEEFNKEWLRGVRGGLEQLNPKYTNEWLFDWVHSGWLAESALSGFLDGRQFGVRNIDKVVFQGVKNPGGNYQLL